MKQIVLLIIICISTLHISGQDLRHKNKVIAYDASFNCVYYANNQIAFFNRGKTFYYKDGIKAYEPRYKNIFYPNGEVAYNKLYRNIYYSNGNSAYNSKKGIIYDKEGKVIKNRAEIPETGYIIEEENIKITIKPYNKITFEVKLEAEDFYYTTDIQSYIKIYSKTDNQLLRTLTIRI